MLIFQEGQKEPFLCVKIPRYFKYIENLKNECNNLKYMEEKYRGNQIIQTIPVFSRFEMIGPYRVLIQEVLPGEVMSSQLSSLKIFNKKIVKKHFERAIGWLVNFHQLSIKKRINLRSPEFRSSYHKIKKQFSHFSNNSYEATIKKLEKSMINVEPCSIPIIDRHGDFNPQNVLLSKKNQISLIDWELFESQKLPFYDLFTFFTVYGGVYGQALKSLNFIDSFYHSFYEDSWYNKLINEYLCYYCTMMDIDQRLVSLFYFLYWMEASTKKIKLFSDQDFKKIWDRLEELYNKERLIK